jgi:hypothetical protein
VKTLHLVVAAVLATIPLASLAQAPATDPAKPVTQAKPKPKPKAVAPAVKKAPVKKVVKGGPPVVVKQGEMVSTTAAPIKDKSGNVIPTSPNAYNVDSAMAPKKP